MTSTAAAPLTFLAYVGNLSMHRSDDATAYLLTVTTTGEVVGVYPTAKAAREAGIARIASAYKGA